MSNDLEIEKEAYAYMQKAYDNAVKGYERNVREWSLDKVQQWSIDPAKGTITFTLPTQVANCSVQIIGTYSKDDPIELHGKVYTTTFMWAWDNENVPKPLQEAAFRVKAWGEQMERPLLTSQIVPADENTAMTFMSLAASLCGGSVYAVDTSPTTRMYMIFDDVKFSDQ